MKLWKKNIDALKEVEAFTVGLDREMDLHLASFDVLGSLAHIKMLASIGLLTQDEWVILDQELKALYKKIKEGTFIMEEGMEDVHSQVEYELTKKLGEAGKKIHSGRSRNDQVLVDLKLFFRSEIEEVVTEIKILFDLLVEKSEAYKDYLMPGYTHLQLAMPSSFGLWFGAYAESLVDDVITLEAAYRIVNHNPLGSAAGYGSSFPLNRELTTRLLGFEDLAYNVVYAQMGRGKTERILASALSNVASTLGKLSMDSTLFLNQHFGFIKFPEALTTGSSIMPHKKNPDVFEIIRGRSNQLLALPNDIAMLTSNLPSGYHREMQLLKEKLFPGLNQMKACLKMTVLMLSNVEVEKNILMDEKYKYIFSVEEVNKLVLNGIPFRDAYLQIGKDIEGGNFFPDRNIHHTHEGSLGNLCLDKIRKKMETVLSQFNFGKANEALETLLR